MRKDTIFTEEIDHIRVVSWLEEMKLRYPNLRYYHTPNGGLRNKVTAIKMKALGTKKGVPDLCFPMPRQGFGGLYIEMKRAYGGRLTPEQKDWIKELKFNNYRVEVCEGQEPAMAVIKDYFNDMDLEDN
jgi:hypothetical protein